MELGKLNKLAVLICFTFLVSIPPSSFSSSLTNQQRVGDICDSNLDCSDIQGSVKCETALLIPLCLCNKGFVGNEVRNNCLPIRQEEGQLCSTDSQCSSGHGLGKLSRCERGHCECFDSNSQEGKSKTTRYDMERKKCVFGNQEKKLKSQDFDTFTSTDETETTTITTTSPRWPPVLPPPLIGEACTSTENCLEDIEGPVQCKDTDASSICQCDEGYEENESRRKCVEIEEESDQRGNHATYLIVSGVAMLLNLIVSFNYFFSV